MWHKCKEWSQYHQYSHWVGTWRLFTNCSGYIYLFFIIIILVLILATVLPALILWYKQEKDSGWVMESMRSVVSLWLTVWVLAATVAATCQCPLCYCHCCLLSGGIYVNVNVHRSDVLNVFCRIATPLTQVGYDQTKVVKSHRLGAPLAVKKLCLGSVPLKIS